MNKRLLALLTITLIVNGLTANPVGEGTARKAAQGFTQTAFAEASRSDAMHLVSVQEAYYVFNIGTSGFVIISTDDCFRPVVGYSDEGVFPTENPSPEMMYYLNNLSQGRAAALAASIRQESEVADEWQRLLSGQPLPSRNGHRKAAYLVKTKWNQGNPYNKFCPSEGSAHTYAGCVATAMSQVMNYWQYPTHGFGRHSYTHYSYGELSADFAAATYRFDLMPARINDHSPEEQIDAVAGFMYHCGIAVDMGYGLDGSGAYSEDVPEAVLKYFGYTNRSRLVYRDEHSLEEFQALLKAQFDMGWPVYYSGSDEDGSGGHAFVCDGYDENDMFHFNWGWSGSGDGFYAIDALNVSSYAFNSGQAFIANYVPEEVFLNTSKAPEAFVATPNGDDAFSVTLSWTNPMATIDGKPIDSIDQIVIMRNGESVLTFDHPTPGEQMTVVDSTHLPITVNFTVHAVVNGISGRKAHADGINLGPACPWTVTLESSDSTGWGAGLLTLVNSSGMVLAELTPESKEASFEVEVPMGRVALRWKAPADSLTVGIQVTDSEGQPVFAYNGPSTLMPEGTFLEPVNTCGGEPGVEAPSDLKAEINDGNVVLHWTGIDKPCHGYIVYRDGYFYTMVTDTYFTDLEAASGNHTYYITAFLKEGESDPSNTVFELEDTPDTAPRNLDFEIVARQKTKLSWEAPEQPDRVAAYLIYRKAQGEEYKEIEIVGGDKTSYKDSAKLPDGNRYYYMVTAYLERDYDETTPARSLRHPDQHCVEVNRTHIPAGLTLDEQDGNLLLQWEIAVLAETYNVYRNGEKIAEDITETQYTLEGDGEPAYFQVTGVLNGVESSPSNKVCYASYAVDETLPVHATLYPNPTSGLTVVQADGIRVVKVYNVTGQHLFDCQGTGDKALVDLSSQSPGVYFLRISTNHGEQVQKLVLTQSF